MPVPLATDGGLEVGLKGTEWESDWVTEERRREKWEGKGGESGCVGVDNNVEHDIPM